jgi:hypothetical protein
MDQGDDRTSGEPSAAEAFEQGDEALDEAARVDPGFLEEMERDPSLDPALQVDERELEEAGATFDDPESKVILEGGIDDPDGLGEPIRRAQLDDEGWDLDAPVVPEHDADLDPGE